MDAQFDPLSNMLLAAGAIGGAAFAIVDALKAWIGHPVSKSLLRRDEYAPVLAALEPVHGKGVDDLLASAFVAHSDKLAETLRAGLRTALAVGSPTWLKTELAKDTRWRAVLVEGESPSGQPTPTDAELQTARDTLGVLESAIDARVDGMVAKLSASWEARLRGATIFVSVALSLALVLVPVAGEPRADLGTFVRGLALGVLATPLAPISKDLAASIAEIRGLLRGFSRR